MFMRLAMLMPVVFPRASRNDAATSGIRSISLSLSVSAIAVLLEYLGAELKGFRLSDAYAHNLWVRVAMHNEACALAYWGMAMTYVHPLWPDVPPDEAFERGSSS